MESDIEKLNIEEVKQSYLRCTENEKFIPRFYEIFLNKDPAIKAMFVNTDFTVQNDLLKRGIMSLISVLSDDGIAGKVTFRRLRKSHSAEGMNIQFQHYLMWKESLLETLSKIDPEWDMIIERWWNAVIDKGIIEMTKKE